MEKKIKMPWWFIIARVVSGYKTPSIYVYNLQNLMDLAVLKDISKDEMYSKYN